MISRAGRCSLPKKVIYVLHTYHLQITLAKTLNWHLEYIIKNNKIYQERVSSLK